MHEFESLDVTKPRIGLHWFGQSSYAVKDHLGTIVQLDPYFPSSRPEDRFIYQDSPLYEPGLETHYVLLTHDHGDHTCMESIERIHKAFPTAQFVGPPESCQRMVDGGISKDVVTEITAGESQPLATWSVMAVWAKPPEGDPEAGIDPPDVQHLGYILKSGPISLYFSGDPINNFSEHDELLGAVAAHAPQIGILTTHPDEGEFPFFEGSVDIALKLGLEIVIPSHYSCFVSRNFDPHEWAARFPAEGPTPLILPYNQSVVIPQ